MHRVRKWVNTAAWLESRPVHALDSLALRGQQSLINCLHMYNYKNVSEWSNQIQSDGVISAVSCRKFPEDGKRSLSGVVHELDSTQLPTLVERPSWRSISCHTYERGYIQWLALKAVQPACTASTIHPGYKPFSQLIKHSSCL